MCTHADLARAAELMQASTRNRTNGRQVAEVAKLMERGKANDSQIASAKRKAKAFLPRRSA